MQQAGKHKKHHQHDEMTMPGLRGIVTTQVEISDLKNKEKKMLFRWAFLAIFSQSLSPVALEQ